MSYDYEQIVREWFEEWKMPFINYIRANYSMSYDEVADLYVEVWIELRKIILSGKATDNKWKSLIFTIGTRQAQKIKGRTPRHVSIDRDDVWGEDSFSRGWFELELAALRIESKSVYENPELQMVLGEELGYIPDPCNKILKLYYYENMPMTDIACAMNYSNSRSAITTKNRCMDKLKTRVKRTVSRLGIMEADECEWW
jgi:DNA-directed RNA polymerase specialized sigma24 family protein